MVNNQRITDLIFKDLQETLTSSERVELDEWLKQNEHLRKYVEEFGIERLANARDVDAMKKILKNEDYRREYTEKLLLPGRTAFFNRPFFRIAASIIILLGCVTVGWLFGYGPNKAEKHTDSVASQDVAPGGDRAILTLSDGSQLLLDSAANGTLTQQGGTQVVKLADGQLAYNVSGESENTVLYNTMSTPRGGQYRITLPDGTKVWLNAASSIKYPTQFSGNERRVSVTGEVYLEVAKNSFIPFYVDAEEADIQVLGTSFNINAYKDEPVLKTTLLEGSLKVNSKKGSGLLTPGDEAVIRLKDAHFSINEAADLKKTVAWKNGEFSFEKASINDIMRQLSRWYDVEVEYKDVISGGFYASIKRSENISKILQLLSLTNKVDFLIEGKKITVTKHKEP